MHYVILGVIASVISYFLYDFIQSQRVKFKVEKFINDQYVGFQVLKERKKFLSAFDTIKYGDSERVALASKLIKQQEEDITDNKTFGFIKRGEKFYKRTKHIEVIIPDIINTLIETREVDKIIHEDSSENDCELISRVLKDGTILKPILMSERDYDGHEDTSYIERVYTVVAINTQKEWDYEVLDTTNKGVKEGSGKDWYYQVSTRTFLIKQIGNFDLLGVKIK